MLSVCPGATFWPVSASRPTMVPAELRTLVTSVTLEATAEPLFVKSTVTFVGVPVAEGSGETACSEIFGADDELGDDDGDDDGLADDDGVADDIGL